MKNIFIYIIAILLIVMVVNLNQIKNLKEEIKVKNEIIEIDNQIIEKHEREIEIYGDFIVGILKGEDRQERLNRQEVLDAGKKLMEIKKEIEKILKFRMGVI